MKVCMIVFNNVTKDHRVVREAETLQAAGHEVHVVGIPDAAASAPVEILESGVTVHRVLWQANAYASLLKSAALRIAPSLIVLLALVAGLVFLIERALASAARVAYLTAKFTHLVGGIIYSLTWVDAARYLLFIVVAVAAFYAIGRLTAGYFEAWSARKRMRAGEDEMVRRFAGELLDTKVLDSKSYPRFSSRVPDWLPEAILELILEPMDWLSGRSGRFVLYRYRAVEAAKLVIKLKPDVVHAHDCIALPAAVAVKKALGIPVVYDAHEVYDAAASRTIGIVDYFIRIHHKNLQYVDRFITINDSAARFYRYAYPGLVPAVVLRNAPLKAPEFEYDGRLHAVAGIPRSRKILLYQGGYTPERGLPTIVRAARYFPDDWVLVLMGWGPLAGPLRRLAAVDERRRRKENSGIDPALLKKVIFVPGVKHTELPFWTAGATAGIIPYENTVFNHWICSPNKLWEFPNAGVPIVVQPFPELRAVAETHGCGWVLPPDMTPGTIADLVSSLDDEMIAEAREACKRFIAADCWEAVYAGRLTKMYAGIKKSERTGAAAPRSKTLVEGAAE